MSDSPTGIIMRAIETKANISATYRGHYRELSPHALGHKDSKLHLISVQVGGTSSSGLSTDPSENWRCMAVADLSAVATLAGEWQSAPNHSRPNTCIDEYLAEVDH